jgi:hypothetical protein
MSIFKASSFASKPPENWWNLWKSWPVGADLMTITQHMKKLGQLWAWCLPVLVASEIPATACAPALVQAIREATLLPPVAMVGREPLHLAQRNRAT